MFFPVFLDSENLTSLDSLTEHVRMSCNLIFLLTPEVLRRPWCLLEVVTAFNNFVNIVLVRVERPGYTFEYPDEDFYATLSQGRFLSQEAEDILDSEGVPLCDLERILRQ